ncbi:MAG: SemiSWEET transporter [Mobilitalea sp.]
MTAFIGYTASVLSTIAFLPQAVYVIRSHDTKSISLLTYIIFVLSVVFWFVYGIILRDIPIIASNLVCIVLGSIILGYKIWDVIHKK